MNNLFRTPVDKSPDPGNLVKQFLLYIPTVALSNHVFDLKPPLAE